MVYVYVGGGAYLLGVPARDLSQDEWDALPPEAQAVALERGLYKADGGPSMTGGRRKTEDGGGK